MKSYELFYEAVKNDVSERLAGFELSEDELNDYLKKEESQIKGAYEEYITKEDAKHLTDEACFMSKVSTVSMCLEYCY